MRDPLSERYLMPPKRADIVSLPGHLRHGRIPRPVISTELPSLHTPQRNDADRPIHDELERVPDADKSNDIEPAGRPVDESRANARGEKVRDGEKHRGHA